MAPELVREFIRAFHEEVNQTAAKHEQEFEAGRRQLETIERKIASIVAAIEEGNYSRALGDRLSNLEHQQESLRARQNDAPPSTVRLHPRLTKVYVEKVQQLENALNDPDIRHEAAEVLRGLIDRIELRPRRDSEGLDALLHGDLAEVLSFCDGNRPKRKLPGAGGSGSLLSVVAGARNQRCLHLNHAIL